MHRTILVAAAAAVSLTVAGCSSFGGSSEKLDYKKASTLPPLEVPPDLTAPARTGLEIPAGADAALGTVSSSDAAVQTTASRSVLPEYESVKVRRDGDMRWLVVQAAPERIWKDLRAFWLEQGFELAVEEPAIGVMETQWAENRADIPKDMVRNFIGKMFDNIYSAPTRDKFRMRIEPGQQAGVTEVYVTHYGVEEIMTGGETGAERGYWRKRPTDPELVNEVLNRMMVYLGAREQQAETLLAQAEQSPSRAHMIEDGPGGALVVVEERFPRAWRRAGLALERLGLVVEDRDRTNGIFYVRRFDSAADASGGKSKGGLFGWFGGSDDEAKGELFQVRLRPAGEEAQTGIAVFDAEGERDNSQAAVKLLERLALQLQ